VSVGESENVAAVRRFADAFNRRDFDSVLAEVAPDAELHEWPAGPDARSYRGPDEVPQAIESWFEAWEWMKVEVEIRSFNVYTFRDGKLIRMQLFTEREAALEAFGLTDEQIRQEAR
jgi:ketosteroid isomerase-like protein